MYSVQTIKINPRCRKKAAFQPVCRVSGKTLLMTTSLDMALGQTHNHVPPLRQG
jgi:hypothetical protein